MLECLRVPEREIPVSYLRLRPARLQSVRCWRAGGRYWAQAEIALCFPAQLWSGATRGRKNTGRKEEEKKTDDDK